MTLLAVAEDMALSKAKSINSLASQGRCDWRRLNFFTQLAQMPDSLPFAINERISKRSVCCVASHSSVNWLNCGFIDSNRI